MTQVALENLSSQWTALVEEARRGEEVLFTERDQPVARLVPVNSPRVARQAGSAKHLPHYMAADFDAIPEGFDEYMP